MQTYKYHFPTSGNIEGALTSSMDNLETALKDSPECLGAYCIFPSDSNILDHVSFDMKGTKGDKITGINLHTYTKLWDGCEADLKTCLEENLKETGTPISITGDVLFLGKEGTIPDRLYHITEEKRVEQIKEQGLIPQTGSNNYKNAADYVYMAEKKDIAPWLSILKHLDSPVLLEIDTKKTSGIEQGRMFNDRDYLPDGYSEYRTKEKIPPEAVRVLDFNRDRDGLGEQLKNDLINQIKQVQNEMDFNEAMTGITRLKSLGIIEEDREEYKIGECERAKDCVANLSVSEAMDLFDEDYDDSPPWDENDNGRSPDDEFANAIESLSGTQMTLEDFGVK